MQPDPRSPSAAKERRKSHTGNPPAGKLRIPRDTYERMMRALGKEPRRGR